MPPDLSFADQVLKEAVRRGNSQQEIQAHLDTLDAAGQEQFINESAQAFGMKPAAVQQAVASPQPQASEPPVMNPSPNEAIALGAADVTGFAQPLARQSATFEYGLGKTLDVGRKLLGKEPLYENTDVNELTEETQDMLAAGKRDYPGRTLIGQTAAGFALPAKAAAAPIQAAIGATQGYTGTEGTTGEKLTNAAIGGVAGALGGKAAEGLGQMVAKGGRFVGNVAENLGEVSTAAARRAVGFTQALIKKAGGKDRVNKMIKVLQEEGLFTKGIGLDKIGERVDELANIAANRLDGLHSGDLGRQPGVGVQELKEAIARRVQEGLEKVRELHPEKLKQLEAVDALISRISEGADSFNRKQLWDLTKAVGEKAWEKGVTNENLSVFQDVWKVLKDAGMRGARRAGPEVYDELAKANRIYSAAAETGKAIADKTAKQAGNRTFGLMKGIVTGTGGLVGGLPGAIAGYVAETGAEKYGMQAVSAAARGAQRAAAFKPVDKLLKLAPKLGAGGKAIMDAAARGSAAVVTTDFVLQQISPEYREKKRKEEEGELE